MRDAPLQVALGTVETLISNLQFTFVVNESGDAHLELYATDPSDAGKGSIVVMLGASGLERLKAIIKDVDDIMESMNRAGRIKRTVLPY